MKKALRETQALRTCWL